MRNFTQKQTGITTDCKGGQSHCETEMLTKTLRSQLVVS